MIVRPLVALIMDRKDARTALVPELAKACPSCRWEVATTWEEASPLLRRGDLEVLVIGLGSVLATKAIEESRIHCASAPLVLVAAEATTLPLLRPGLDFCLTDSPDLARNLASAVQTLLERIELRRRATHAEARLSEIQERVPIGIFRATPDGRLVESNPALLKMLSIPSSRAGAGFHLNDFCSPGQGVEEAMERAASTGHAQSLEVEFRRADGQSAWMALTLWSGRDGSGGTCVDGVVEDVTERKKAEKALGAARVRESHLLASLPMVLYTVKGPRDLRTTWISENVQRVTGIPRARFLNEPGLWMSRVHPEDRERVEAEIAALEEGTSATIEYRWKGSNVEWLWFLDHALLARDTTGRAHEVLGTRLDVTERKRVERGMLEMATALENAVEGISRVGTDGKYQVANRSYADLLGVEPYDLIGHDWTDVLHPEDREHTSVALRRMADVGKAVLEVRAIRRDGTTPWLELTLVRARCDEEGGFAGFYCFAKDVTDRHIARVEQQTQTEGIQAVAGALAQYLSTGDRRLSGSILVREAVRQTGSAFGLMAIKSDGDSILVIAVDGSESDSISRLVARGEFRVAAPGAPIVEVLQRGAPVVLMGAATAPPLGEDLPSWRTFLGAPLFAAGEVAGVLLVSDKPLGYTQADLARIQVLCQAGGTLLEPPPRPCSASTSAARPRADLAAARRPSHPAPEKRPRAARR